MKLSTIPDLQFLEDDKKSQMLCGMRINRTQQQIGDRAFFDKPKVIIPNLALSVNF